MHLTQVQILTWYARPDQPLGFSESQRTRSALRPAPVLPTPRFGQRVLHFFRYVVSPKEAVVRPVRLVPAQSCAAVPCTCEILPTNLVIADNPQRSRQAFDLEVRSLNRLAVGLSGRLLIEVQRQGSAVARGKDLGAKMQAKTR